MKIDKILSEKQSEKLEDVFYMDQLVEHFTETEIKNLRYLIETTEGRCIGCGTFSALNNKKYCKKCATNNTLKFRK
jgi:rRNA maturation endonuclease Nob1